MKIIRALLKAISGSKEFCCLCLKGEIENLIHIEDEVLIDGLETNEYSEIGDLLQKIFDKDIFEVIKLFGTICKPCSTSAINCYKFIQSTYDNYQQLVKTLDNLSNSLQFANESSKTFVIDLNTNKHFHVNKIFTSSHEILQNFMVFQALHNKESKKAEEMTEKLYKCKLCTKLFSSADGLENHASNKHSEKHKYDTCKHHLAPTALVKAHKHIQKSKYICTVCGKVFFQKRALENHEARHRSTIVCSDCGRIYKSKDSFRIHIVHNICNSKSRAPPHNGKYICDYCNKRYTQKMTLRTHIQYEHLNYKAHECKYCKKRFWAQSRLKTHILKHTKEKNFKCTTCGGRFATKDTLLYHTRMHTGEKPYECEICGEKFISASRRLLHNKKEHLKETFKCQICNLEYTTKYRLQKHINLNHGLGQIDMIKHLQFDEFKQDQNVDVDSEQYFQVYDGLELIVGI